MKDSPSPPRLPLSPGQSGTRFGIKTRALVGLSVCAVLFLPLAAGCGGGGVSEAKNEAAEETKTEQEAPPAPKPAPNPPKKKQARKGFAKKNAQVAAAEEPANPAPQQDIRKWQVADLKSAVTHKQLQFVGGVMLYSMQRPNDAQRAKDLGTVLAQVARMPDDATIPVPLPQGSLGPPIGASSAAAARGPGFGGGAVANEPQKVDRGERRRQRRKDKGDD